MASELNRIIATIITEMALNLDEWREYKGGAAEDINQGAIVDLVDSWGYKSPEET